MTDMSDLEITKACAEKMGLYPSQFGYGEPPFEQTLCGRGQGGTYDPLHDDAQAMALVKKFDIVIERECKNTGRRNVTATKKWGVTLFYEISRATNDRKYTKTIVARNACDLNRAICECVAKMK